MRVLAASIALALLVNVVSASAQLATDEFASQGRGILAAAGYQSDTASLMRALQDPEDLVVHMATYLLSKQRATPDTMAALQVAAETSNEALAVSAFSALRTLRASGWESVAIARLSVMRDPIAPLQLSGVLAQAGHNEGWPILKAALDSSDSPLAVAIENAIHFDGLRDASGTVIDAVVVLEEARKRHASKLQQMYGKPIDSAVGRVRARRLEKTP